MSCAERGKYALLTDLISYPTKKYMGAAISSNANVVCANEESQNSFIRFQRFVAGSSLTEMEELYTRTFDINPVCSLEIGWHLFGEQYERGAFMVRMRGMLRAHKIAESAELPDHLGHALLLLEEMSDEESALLAREILPAIVKMHEGLAAGRGSAEEQKDNPFRELLFVILESVRTLIMRASEAETCRMPAPSIKEKQSHHVY